MPAKVSMLILPYLCFERHFFFFFANVAVLILLYPCFERHFSANVSMSLVCTDDDADLFQFTGSLCFLQFQFICGDNGLKTKK